MARQRPLPALVDAGRAPLDQWPKRYPGFRAVGTLCSYVPGEMLHAAGLTPVRLRSTAQPIRRADAHLQSFTCALCRSTLDQALGGELSFLAGAVLAHTCDAMQALSDLWRINTPADRLVETIMVPTRLEGPAALPYLEAELQHLRAGLAQFTDDELRASIALYDETRRLVQALGRHRERLTAAEFFAVLDAAQVMPPEYFQPLARALLSELETSQASEAHAAQPSGPRLFLVGAVLDEPRLLDLIDASGAVVAGDDLCTGSRPFQGQVGVGTEASPLRTLAGYLLGRTPCPTKFHPAHDPGLHLVDQAAAAGAVGVLFVVSKFCEPHAFDYGLARPALERAGVPHLVLEMEQTPSLEGLRTRLQAFVEIL